MGTALVARQSIYDKGLNVFAYELLFRPGEANESQVGTEFDGDKATSTVLLNTFSDIGLEKVVEDKLAFINFTRNLLLTELLEILPSERVVVEILEDVEVDQELIAHVKKLSSLGYTIALDDFVFRDDLQELVDLADIIKLDVFNATPADIEQQVKQISSFKGKLLAEKIETHEIFEVCKELGFDYFQGYFLSKPNLIKGSSAQASRVITLKLLGELQLPSIDVTDIVKTVRQDPMLSYKLLKIINAASFGVTRNVESIREAVVMLGISKIRNWATLIALASVDGKPHDQLVAAMARAKMCEILAEHLKLMDTTPYFALGMFSMLDALLDMPIDEVLKELPLSDELKQAIQHQQGKMGQMLANIIAFDRGDWDSVRAEPTLNESLYQQAYLSGLEWAKQTTGALR